MWLTSELTSTKKQTNKQTIMGGGGLPALPLAPQPDVELDSGRYFWGVNYPRIITLPVWGWQPSAQGSLGPHPASPTLLPRRGWRGSPGHPCPAPRQGTGASDWPAGTGTCPGGRWSRPPTGCTPRTTGCCWGIGLVCLDIVGTGSRPA